MAAAALYAYGEARQRDIVCLAHVTNSMAISGDDFEKGVENGAHSALEIVEVTARSLVPINADGSRFGSPNRS